MTVKERGLLETLLNPEHRLKPVEEICRISGCCKNVYYDAFKKDGFVKIYTTESKQLVSKALGPIINASIRQALRGDSAHTKILLSMEGVYADKHIFPDKEGNPQPVGNTNVINNITEEKFKTIIEDLNKKI